MLVVIEGPTDRVIISRIFDHLGIGDAKFSGEKGKGYILKNLKKYNQAGRFQDVLILVDLDAETECAPSYRTLIMRGVGLPSLSCMFNIAVHEVESWIMGDEESFSKYFSVSKGLIPQLPEVAHEPKEEFFKLLTRSRSSKIKRDMLPRDNSGTKYGPAYMYHFENFVLSEWRPEEAAKRCPSLKRLLTKLEKVA